MMTIPPASLERDPEAILRFWQRPFPPGARSQPPESLEGWTELFQRAATDLLRREAEIVPLLVQAQGYSAREARRALQCALGGLSRDALIQRWEAEGLHLFDLEAERDEGFSVWPRRTVVFGGGPIPQPSLQAVVGALMASERVLFRPSRQDAVLIPLFAEALAAVQADSPHRAVGGAARIGRIADRLLCGTWPRENETASRAIVNAADSIVIFGDESSITAIDRARRPESELFAYGPRLSFAVLDLTGPVAPDTLSRAIDDFAEDVVAFDQRGCLSPQALYVLGSGTAAVEGVVEALALALDRRAEEGGFTPALPPAVAAEIQSLRAVYAMDPSGCRRLRASPGPQHRLPGWTLLLDAADPTLQPLAGYQTLRVCSLPGWDSVLQIVRPWRGKLQAIGLGPDSARLPEAIAAELMSLGISRLCPVGLMQSPPLDWTHDGNPFFPLRLPL